MKLEEVSMTTIQGVKLTPMAEKIQKIFEEKVNEKLTDFAFYNELSTTIGDDNGKVDTADEAHKLNEAATILSLNILDQQLEIKSFDKFRGLEQMDLLQFPKGDVGNKKLFRTIANGDFVITKTELDEYIKTEDFAVFYNYEFCQNGWGNMGARTGLGSLIGLAIVAADRLLIAKSWKPRQLIELFLPMVLAGVGSIIKDISWTTDLAHWFDTDDKRINNLLANSSALAQWFYNTES